MRTIDFGVPNDIDPHRYELRVNGGDVELWECWHPTERYWAGKQALRGPGWQTAVGIMLNEAGE